MTTTAYLKRSVAALVCASFPVVAFAGLSYRFETVTGGLTAGTVSGVVSVEGNHSRVDVEHGDGAVLADHSFVLAGGDGQRLIVADPAARTYYEIGADDLGGGAGAILERLRSMFSVKVVSPRATLRTLGAGPDLEGYPTIHQLLTTSCGIALGGSTTPSVTLSTRTETWVTPRIPAASASVLLSRDLRSGLPEIDRLITAQNTGPAGFPLEQTTVTRLVQNGTPIEVTATTTVRTIRTMAIPAIRFVLPAGYRRVENPIEKAMKALGTAH